MSDPSPPDRDWTWTVETSFASRRNAHLDCMQEILAQLSDQGWEGRDLFGIEMTLEETLTNAIRHGNKCDESKNVFVHCKVGPQDFWMRIRDEGEGFCLSDVPDCTAEDNLNKCGGRGVMLIQAYMDRVDYNDCGNCVTLEKSRTS